MEDLVFLTAHFIDNERKTVQAYWTEMNKSEIVEEIIEVKDTDLRWQNLMSYITVDELHENTYKNIKASEEAFREQVIEIARERGWIYDIDQAANSEIYKAIVKVMYQPFDPVEHKELLFFLKMELFEHEVVKKCLDKDLKKELRKAPDLIGAMEVACKIYRANHPLEDSGTAG